jgi:hypothetical protein
MKNQKKITAFIFILTGFLPVLFTLTFLFRQQLIRHEMKEKLEKESVCIIAVPVENVVWFKYKKEIIIDGRMFDVKSFSSANGIVIFKGLYDDDETALVEYLEKNLNKKNTPTNRLLTDLFQLLQSIYNENALESITVPTNIPSYANLTLLHISSPFINIVTPPPQA